MCACVRACVRACVCAFYQLMNAVGLVGDGTNVCTRPVYRQFSCLLLQIPFGITTVTIMHYLCVSMQLLELVFMPSSVLTFIEKWIGDTIYCLHITPSQCFCCFSACCAHEGETETKESAQV